MRLRLHLLALVAAVALAAAAEARAHAQFVSALPAAEAVLARPPAAVRVEFNEPVALIALSWVLPGGAQVAVEGRVEGATLVLTPPPELPEGTHLVSWRVVSLDGHPIAGTQVFSIGAPTGAGPAPVAATGTAELAAGARFLLTLALAFGAGGAVFARLVDPGPHRGAAAARLARWAALATPAAALLALAAQRLDLTGLPPAALLRPEPWATVLGTRFAAAMGVAALAGVAAAVALIRGGRAPAGLAWALGAASFALAGHAAVAPPVWATAPAMALHGAAVLFWVGALPPLAALAAAGGPELGARLRAFARVAVSLVALLVASGALVAVAQLGTVAALWSTGYGRLLAAKLAAVAVMLALAADHRFRLTPAVVAGRPGAAPRLARGVRAEVALAVLVLALAAGFRLTPPPRALAEAAAASVAEGHLHGAAAAARVALRPGRAGATAVEVTFADAGPSPQAVTVSFARPEAGIERLSVKAARGADGIWRAGPVTLPLAGTWAVRVEVLIDDFTATRLDGAVTLAP